MRDRVPIAPGVKGELQRAVREGEIKARELFGHKRLPQRTLGRRDRESGETSLLLWISLHTL